MAGRAVARTELTPKAPSPTAVAQKISEELPVPVQAPLVWPIGLAQRKGLEPKLRESIFNPKRSEAGRLFLRCVSPFRVYRVQVRITGERVGSWLSLAPGELVEIEWRQSPRLSRDATYNGLRDEILAYEDNTKAVDAAKPILQRDGAMKEVMGGFIAYAEQELARVRRVLPADLPAWKSQIRSFQFEATYTDSTGTTKGRVGGSLKHTMERMWFEFEDDSGFDQPVT